MTDLTDAPQITFFWIWIFALGSGITCRILDWSGKNFYVYQVEY